MARIPHMIGREGTIIEVPNSTDGGGWYKVRTDSSRKPVKVQLAGLAIIEPFTPAGAAAGNGSSPRKSPTGDARASPARRAGSVRDADERPSGTSVRSDDGDGASRGSPYRRRTESRASNAPAKPTLLSNTDSATWMGATVQVSTGKGRRTQATQGCSSSHRPPLHPRQCSPACPPPLPTVLADTTSRPPSCGWARVG